MRLLALVLLGAVPAPAGDLRTSKHNLSTGGTGSIRSTTEDELCVFCHTPHNARPAAPLWNHQSSVAVYSTYTSTTLTVARPLNQPTGSSKLCLSCHDGTVALGQTLNDGLLLLSGTGAGGTMPAGSSDLGIDLTDDHPVSFTRNPVNSETLDPPPGDPVGLDETGKVQCVSCHDPHREDRDVISLKFLVKSNQASALCLTCHRPRFWDTNPTTHKTSVASYSAARGAHTGYTTVRDNGCESCHRPHSGNQPQRLLKFVEEATCNQCHNGSVAAKDVAREFNKIYVHPTLSRTPSVHDAAESPSSPSTPLPETNRLAERHAECEDCHNPHASFAQTASAPNITGALSGVWGIDSAGGKADPSPYEYQICYKCHGDSTNKPQESGLPYPPYTRRQIVQFNVRLEFDPANPSHHAVEGPGRNTDVPSLLPPYTTGSVIRCTDCHNNDAGPGAGGVGPRGPHGSTHNHILERNLNVGDGNTGGNFASMYALCFKCHSQTSIMGDVSFRRHHLHIEGEDSSCMVCHDPHGISASQGNSTSNSHLVNFDLNVIRPSSTGVLRFEDRGTRRGACYLTCHGRDHNPLTY